MKKVTLKDSKGNEINDIMKDVLTFDCETTGLPPRAQNGTLILRNFQILCNWHGR